MSKNETCFEMMKDYPPSVASAKKLDSIGDNFAFYSFEWLGDKPEEWTVMKVIGAQFRPAKSGPHKGMRVIKIKGTERTAYITRDEIEAARTKEPK